MILDPSVGNLVQYFSLGSNADGLSSSDGGGPGRPTETLSIINRQEKTQTLSSENAHQTQSSLYIFFETDK